MLFLWRFLGCCSLRSNSRPPKERKKEKDLKELESSLNMFCLRSKGVKEFKIIYLSIYSERFSFKMHCLVLYRLFLGPVDKRKVSA